MGTFFLSLYYAPNTPTGKSGYQGYPPEIRPRRRNRSVGTRADRGETDLSNTLSAGRQQRTETKRKERKEDNYAKQSQNTKGLQIGEP